MSDESDLERRFGRFEAKLDGVADSLKALVRLEERDKHTQERLREGAAKMGDLDKRLTLIELAMPGLLELRRYALASLSGVLALLAVSILRLVFPGI